MPSYPLSLLALQFVRFHKLLQLKTLGRRTHVNSKTFYEFNLKGFYTVAFHDFFISTITFSDVM